MAGHQGALEVPVPRPPPRVGHQVAVRWLWRTAARTVSRTPATIGRPASAMSACFGVEMGRASGDGPVRSAQLTTNFHVGRRDHRKSGRCRIYFFFRKSSLLATHAPCPPVTLTVSAWLYSRPLVQLEPGLLPVQWIRSNFRRHPTGCGVHRYLQCLAERESPSFAVQTGALVWCERVGSEMADVILSKAQTACSESASHSAFTFQQCRAPVFGRYRPALGPLTTGPLSVSCPLCSCTRQIPLNAVFCIKFKKRHMDGAPSGAGITVWSAAAVVARRTAVVP